MNMLPRSCLSNFYGDIHNHSTDLRYFLRPPVDGVCVKGGRSYSRDKTVKYYSLFQSTPHLNQGGCSWEDWRRGYIYIMCVEFRQININVWKSWWNNDLYNFLLIISIFTLELGRIRIGFFAEPDPDRE